MSALSDALAIHLRINHYMLGGVAPEALSTKAGGKGRTVAEQFAHLHNVRLMWVQAAAPDLAEGVQKLGKDGLTTETLIAALSASDTALLQLVERGLAQGKIKGFKPSPEAFVGYIISHESHHRGQIALTLKQAGFPLDKKIGFGLWEWGVR